MKEEIGSHVRAGYEIDHNNYNDKEIKAFIKKSIIEQFKKKGGGHTSGSSSLPSTKTLKALAQDIGANPHMKGKSLMFIIKLLFSNI